MITLDLQGTKLSFGILPSKKGNGNVETEISVKNDYFSYHNQAADTILIANDGVYIAVLALVHYVDGVSFFQSLDTSVYGKCSRLL